VSQCKQTYNGDIASQNTSAQRDLLETFVGEHVQLEGLFPASFGSAKETKDGLGNKCELVSN
jgi:hypothetical protein